MISIKELTEKLLKEKSVALFCHVRPDGDTLCSALGLKLALNKKGIKAEVFSSDAVPEKFGFINGISTVKRDLDGDYSAFVAIDNADLSRLGIFSEEFSKHKNTYSIDHHISNTRYAKYNYVVEKASNSENVLDLIKYLGVEIDGQMANILATGIVTDSGNFRHKNTTAETLENASQLVAHGADLNNITYHTFTEQSKERAKLFGIAMSKLRYFYDDKIAIATVRLADFETAGATQDVTEGFIDFVMGINTVEVGLCVMETALNKFKISFRSKGTDVNAVASTFGGGGHNLASGCQINGEYEEVIDKLVFATSRHIKD